ncbi:MAG: hypothetical protein QOD09_472 [Bradyrhizobium sp.]|nr:hypothetical protein [Bradyrhizobium sp.]
MIRKLQSGEYRLYSRKLNPKTGKRRNLGTFKSRAAAEKHERAVQYFKRLSVIAGLDPAIHLLRKTLAKSDGYAGQARV